MRQDTLRGLCRRLEGDCERAEARIPPLNAAIAELQSLGLLPETILLGPAIFDRPYDATRDDAYTVFQAELLIPGGLGVVAWDNVEDAAQARSPSRDPGRAFERFVAFSATAPGLKALLLPHADDLVDRLLELATPPSVG